MDKLNFSYNWNNKLDCFVFTSIRLATGKYRLGETYQVFLKGSHYCNVKLIDVAVITLDKLKPWIAYLDTGYDLKEAKAIIQKMYPDVNWNTQLVAVLLFKRVSMPHDPEVTRKQPEGTISIF